MSENQPTNVAVMPSLFIVGVIAVLVILMTPRLPERVATVATPDEAASAQSEQPQPIVEIDKSTQDFMTLLMLGEAEVNASSVRTGQRLFGSSCSSCHGYDAKGLPGNGKTLINSTFVNSLSDQALIAFIVTGRTPNDAANTTGVNMPAKGGNLSLSDADLQSIVDYIRGLNGATVIQDAAAAEATPIERREFTPLNLGGIDANAAQGMPSSGTGETPSLATPTATPEPVATAEPTVAPSSSTGTADADTLATGEAAYLQSCASCHAVDLKGVSYIPYTDMSEATFDGDTIVKMLTEFGFRLNGYSHPFRGGVPELTDAQIDALIVYLQSR